METARLSKVPELFLLLCGLWPFKITNNILFTKMYNFYTKYQLISYVSVILNLLLNLVYTLVKRNQPERIISSLNMFIIVFEICLKVVIFQLQKVPLMFSEISKYEAAMRASNDAQVRKYYEQEVQYCRRVNIFQFLVTFFACSGFAHISIMRVVASEDMSEFKNTPFMHDLWYPFKREKHMPWVMTVAILCDTQGLFCNAASQSTLICLMIYARTRLIILQIRLKKFDKIAQEQYHGNAERAIKELINEHQDLIKFVQLLNDRTKYVLLLEFILNSLCVASGTLQFLIIDTPAGRLSTFCLNFYIVVQIFILSWHANEITEQGLGVAASIAASNWHKQSKEVKTLLIVMMMRAQIPFGLTVGSFFRMTNSTALQTMKVAYSYMSIMRQNIGK
uniref:Odorant receptor n=3 Tax=Dendroctonus ponderosae TaxID=77166 RepID=A0AAR5P3Q4_DENPD